MPNNLLEIMTTITPSIVTALYFLTGVCYIFRKDYAWAWVWISYAMANFGLIVIGLRK